MYVVPTNAHITGLVSQLSKLDPQLTDKLEIIESCPEICDQKEESELSPPMLYFDRKTRTSVSASDSKRNLFTHNILPKIKSSPNICEDQKRNEIRVLQRNPMTQSMPNLQSNRSLHNRSIGYSVLSSTTECSVQQGKNSACAQVQSFEFLLSQLDSDD